MKPITSEMERNVLAGVSSRLPGLSVFLPCHNEEHNLSNVVDNFRHVLDRFALAHEIIIVDDGSRDATGEIADQMSESQPGIRVVHHAVNRGYGGAVISGLRAARMPHVLLCDGDGQFDAGQLGRLIPMAGHFDVVVGRRTRRADPLVRRLNGRAWTALVRMLFRIAITDVDCGFKLFRRDFICDLELSALGAMVSTELMVKLAGRGARICEVDIEHLPRLAGEQSGANMRVIVRAFAELFRLYRDLRSQRRSSNGLCERAEADIQDMN